MSDGVVGPEPLPRPMGEEPAPAAPTAALSVWPTGQHDEASQLWDGGYVADTAADAERVMPTIAACAITTYSRPGEVVLDPDCGAGTVLVEALRAARHAVGLTPSVRWWGTARANITTAKRHGAWRDGCVLDGYPQLLSTVQAAGLTGRVGLVLTALRPRTGGDDRGAGHDGDQGDGQGRPDRALARLTRSLRHCRPLLRPGGHVIVTARPTRHGDGLLDLPNQVLAAGQAAGLVPLARCVALLSGLRGSRLNLHASLAQRRAVARDHAAGVPTLLPVHHDVLVFRTPALAEPAALAGAHSPRALRAIPMPAWPHPTERNALGWEATGLARAA